jgi:hypothetical protein
MNNGQPGISDEKIIGVECQKVGLMKEKWLEVMFYLSVFFGLLHFASLFAQVGGMILNTAFHIEASFKLKSSMLMGHLYLTFLAAYVGPKEFVRWMKRTDEEALTEAEGKKITRGLYIVVGWAGFTGITALLWQMSFINEVPETLLYTLGEVVTLLCGTEVSKYLRTRQASQVKQDTANQNNFADKVLDYAKVHGSIDTGECCNEFGMSDDQAYRLLKRLVTDKKLVEFGEKRGRKYKPA